MSKPKIRGYRKQMLSLWLQKCMFWLSEQRLVDQANTIGRNSWITELEIEDVIRSRLAEQGPSSSRFSRQENIGRHHANPVISRRRKWTSQENKIVMECSLLSKPKIRGYRKQMLSLWLQKCMFWLSEQRLVDQANIIRRNSWMTELEIEELERKVTRSNSVIVEETRSVEVLPGHK